MAEEELKNLPPEERIRKLKEASEKKKKEIEEAQKLIRDSELELSEKRKIVEKIPLPQVAVMDLKNLTPEEKEIVLSVQGNREKPKLGEEEEKVYPQSRGVEAVIEAGEKKRKSLEEALGGGGKAGSYAEEAEFQRLNADYIVKMSQKPMTSLYQEIAGINREVEEKGYINREEERRIVYLSSAVERKLEDVEMGRYSLTEQAALAANATKQLSEKLRAMYR